MPSEVIYCPSCDMNQEFFWDTGDMETWCPDCERAMDVPFTQNVPRIGEVTRMPAPWAWYETGRRVYLETSLVPSDPSGQNGLRFASSATYDYLGSAYAAIQAWATENNLFLSASRNESFAIYIDGSPDDMMYVQAPMHFTISRTRPLTGEPYTFVPTVCQCGVENAYGRVTCTDCRGVLYCRTCHRYRGAVTREGAIEVCSQCGHECSVEGCETITQNNYSACEEHGNRFTCRYCSSVQEGDDDSDDLCRPCAERWCSRCETGGHDLRPDDAGDELICENCQRSELGAEPDDPEGVLPSTRLALPSIPGREAIRACGIEIEGANDGVERSGEVIARALYDAGLSPHHNMQSYHHGSGFAHVEADSSCDWEVVIGPINMAARTDVGNLNKVVKVVRKVIVDGQAKLDLRSGLHIHVSAERVGLTQAYNLHRMFAYTEDTMYRLGAAKWPLHRSILSGGRRDYCKIGPSKSSKLEFAQTYHGDKYFGLSFTNYFSRMMEKCQCGAARYGMFEECSCALKKCTFEFRFFNTTANAKKIHAYLALTQALVAKALSTPEVVTEAEYPEHLFVSERFKNMSGSQQVDMLESWTERLRWIADELPMTPDELQSLRYCVVNSELSKLGDTIETIIPTTQEVTA